MPETKKRKVKFKSRTGRVTAYFGKWKHYFTPIYKGFLAEPTHSVSEPFEDTLIPDIAGPEWAGKNLVEALRAGNRYGKDYFEVPDSPADIASKRAQEEEEYNQLLAEKEKVKKEIEAAREVVAQVKELKVPKKAKTKKVK